MAEEIVTTTGIAGHGASRLPSVEVDSFNIELKDDDTESFWVDPSVWPHLADEPTFGRRLVVTAMTRQGCPFLWGLRLTALRWPAAGARGPAASSQLRSPDPTKAPLA